MYRIKIGKDYLSTATYGFFRGDWVVAGKWKYARAQELCEWAQTEWPTEIVTLEAIEHVERS